MINDESRWIHFTTESGLPSNDIEVIEEANDGTMWVGTSEGLAWYDGYKWNRLKNNFRLSKSRPQMITFDDNNILIVVSEDDLLHVGYHDIMEKIILPIKRVGAAVPFKNNSIMIYSDSMLYISKKDTFFKFIPLPPGIEPSNETRDLWFTTNRTIWINTFTGLYRLEDAKWILKLPSYGYRMKINYLVEDKNFHSIVSVGSPFNLRGIWESFGDKNMNKSDIPGGDWVSAMDIDKNGLAILRNKSGDFFIKKKSFWYPLKFTMSFIKNVTVLKFQSNTNLWIGTRNGLFLLRKDSPIWTYLNCPPQTRKRVHEILITNKGNVCLGTADGVEFYDKYGNVRLEREVLNLELIEITGIAEDFKRRIWITSGSSFNGAFCFNNDKWNYFTIDSSASWFRIHKIRKDRKDRLWFLGLKKDTLLNSKGLPSVFILEENKVKKWPFSDSLPNGSLYSFVESYDSAYWFGTLSGLSRYKNGVWKHWVGNVELKFSKVFCMAVDNLNNIWFSDRENGLGVMKGNEHFEYYSTKNGLPDNRVWDIACDDKNRIWITTESGLCSFYNGKWKVYGINTGLKTPDLWPVLPAGDSIYVGTRGGGLAILNLNNCHQNPPKIFIEDAIVEENRAAIRVRPYAYWGNPQPREIPIRYSIDNQNWTQWKNNHEILLSGLPPGNHAIHVQAKNIFGEFNLRGQLMYFSVPPPLQQTPQFYLPIGGLSFILMFVLAEYFIRKRQFTKDLLKSESKFRKLTESIFEGIILHEKETIRECNQNMTLMFGYKNEELKLLSLYDLIDGRYHDAVESVLQNPGSKSFEVVGIKKNGKKMWMEMVITSPLHPEYSYAVTAFRDISGRKYAEEKLVSYKNQLRSLASELTKTEERERRRMAAFLHDTISQTLAFCKIKLRSLNLSEQPDNTEKTLQQIRSLIDETIQSTRTLTFELSPPILYEVGLEAAINSLIEQLKHQHDLAFVLVDDHIIKPLDTEMRIILYQAIRELVTNVIKHARANTIKITLAKVNSKFQITVEDDGIGMRSKKNVDGSSREGGFGLFNIRERLQMKGGSINISTQPNRGTKITIIVPLQE